MDNMLTKQDIERIAFTIADELEKLNLAGDTRIYFNNRCIDFDSGTFKSEDALEITYKRTIIENINPHDYFEYCAWNHIISISFEGSLYGYIDAHYELPHSIETLLKEHNLYWELGESWNLSLYPITDDMQIEYTVYQRPTEPTYIFLNSRERLGKIYPDELEHIMQIWYDLGQTVGDVGACVIGQHMAFTYRGINYEMCPITGFQGEFAHVKWIDLIKKLLEGLGATNVDWHCGRLD